MRGRLKRKLARQKTRAKVRLVTARIILSAPSAGPVKDWRFLSAWEREDALFHLLYLADLHAFNLLGRALFPGVVWQITRRGPRMRWA